jgi:hypothetical protein
MGKWITLSSAAGDGALREEICQMSRGKGKSEKFLRQTDSRNDLFLRSVMTIE